MNYRIRLIWEEHKMTEYKPRDFQSTMQAALGPEAARICPVSRYANIYMGKIVDKIVEAQYKVGIPSDDQIKILRGDEFAQRRKNFTKPGQLIELYKSYGIKFQEGTKPLNVIEVCFEPKSPETMRDFFESACRYRDEHEGNLSVPLKVFIGTTQTVERFEYIIKNGYLPDAVVSTNMAPVRESGIKDFCKNYGIVLGPNAGFSSDNLIECLKSQGDWNSVQYDSEWIPTQGAAIQKLFPFGAVNAISYLSAMASTHPGINPMPTGGVSHLTARALMKAGAELLGASAPAKKDALVYAIYAEIVNGDAKAWEDFIYGASVMATETYIGLLERADKKSTTATLDEDLNIMFQEALNRLGR
jgi:hypothetical protein